MEKEKTEKNHTCCSSKTDHRATGEKLNIFGFNELIGPGFPFWKTNGFIIKEIIKKFVNSVQEKYGIQMVSTPQLGKKELYEKSGHWQHYRENIFPKITLDNKDDYILRPMTCPHHILLYKEINRHESHLPIAFGENAYLYRYEYSGGLIGLERTRCMELIDTHIFCTKANLTDSLQKVFEIIQEVKKSFQIEYDKLMLSIRDENKNKFYEDNKLWQETEKILKEFMISNNLKFEIGKGDAAFYGPKIDFQITTHMKKTITISTIQLDFLLPQKFDLQYLKKETGEKGVPIMIHVGIIGTLERFIAYLLERNNGWLPFWISPVQISIIPVDPSKHINEAKILSQCLKKLEIRTKIEDDASSVGKRISKAIQQRSYGYIVVGDQEIQLIKQLKESINKSEKEYKNNLEKIIALTKIESKEKENILNETLKNK